MKERSRTKAEEWMVTDAAGGAFTWKAAAGAQSSKAGVGFLLGVQGWVN